MATRFSSYDVFRNFVYIIVNLFLLFLTIGILVYLGEYINERAIPNDLIWKNGRRTDSIGAAIIQYSLLLIEGAAVTSIFYALNRWFFAIATGMKDEKKVARLTAIINFLVCLFFIGLAIYNFYNE